MPPLNFPERGPRQAPKTHREARFGAGAYSSPRGGQRSAARPLDGTRTGRTPRNLRWKGNQRSTIHRSQRRWRRKPPVPSRPDGGSTRRPSYIRTRRGTKPGRRRSTRQSKRDRDGRGARTGMEDGRDGCSKQGVPPPDFRWATRWGVPRRHHPPNHLLKVIRWETRVGAL